MGLIKDLQDIANILRCDSLTMTTKAKSGHPTSCLSAAEIISCLFFETMSYDTKNPDNPDNDEFILSKGHASPILYSALYHAGAIKHNLLKLRQISSPLEGHPISRSLKWAKVSTGSLGQGLSNGIGFALAAKMQKRKFHTFVLLGDSETAEGSIFEALQLASYYKLNNLTAIIDVNRLGERGETIYGHDLKQYKKIFSSFNWKTILINGHNIKQILKALKKARYSNKPTAIIAKTFKGKGVSFLEDNEKYHGEVLNEQQLKKALNEIPNSKMPKIKIEKPKSVRFKFKKTSLKLPKYNLSEHITTRLAYGQTLASLAKSDSSILAIDAEVSDSSHSDEVKKTSPKQFIETFIAEQDLISIALGLSKKSYKPFASAFSSFLTRAHDQIRMASISSANLTINGCHAGVSTGEDGAPQMGLEDIAMFRDLPNSNIFQPCDAVSTAKIVLLASKTKGVNYIRTLRPKTPVIYKNSEPFPISQFKILRQSKKDSAVLIGSGITVHEAIKAHELLKLKNISTAVIDLYCIKPLNSKKLINFIKSHGKKIVISEDHFKAGGIGEMLSEIISETKEKIQIKHLYVSGIPHSGPWYKLLEKYKINYSSIANAVMTK